MEEVLTNELEEDIASVEIKKELSDENNVFQSDMQLEDDCIASNDGLFEVIPFMAKLLSNLKCSFYSKNNDIIIASIELMSVHELVNRLVKNKILPNRMICSNDSTFTLSICDEQFVKSVQTNYDNIVRFLPHMALVTECSNLSLFIENGEIMIRNISYDSLAALMVRFKQYDIRPKQVDSMKDSVFSLVFNEQSFSNVENIAKLFPADSSGDLQSIRRPRICPNYLRDYVVESKDEPVSGLDLLPTFLSRSSYTPFMAHKHLSGCSSESVDDSPSVKRGRGRPRIRPAPADLSLDSNLVKKPRGRPRRSDVVPNIIARTNSFINIQPKGFSAQEIESCFVKFLESDMAAFRQPK